MKGLNSHSHWPRWKRRPIRNRGVRVAISVEKGKPVVTIADRTGEHMHSFTKVVDTFEVMFIDIQPNDADTGLEWTEFVRRNAP